MRNSDRYLAAFNSVEKTLRRSSNSDYHLPFTKLLSIMAKNSSIVRRYKDDLKEFAELRNALVHEKTNPGYAIAEPHDSIVEKLEEIERELREPRKVTPAFRREVVSFSAGDSLYSLLKIVRKFGYSQFPIYKDNTFIGLLTEKEITTWLAHNPETVTLREVLLEQVLFYQRNEANYQFIPGYTNLYDVKEIFKQARTTGQRLDALLITAAGSPYEPLLGIVTPADLADLP